MPTAASPLAERQRAAQQRVNEAVERMDGAFTALDTAGRTVAEATDETRAAATTAFETAATAFDSAEAEVAEADADLQRVRRMADARARFTDLPEVGGTGEAARVNGGDAVYRRFEGRADNPADPAFHFLRDVYRASCRGDATAMQRLQRHWEQSQAAGGIEARADQGNTTDTSGGEFVPPLWLQSEWVRLPRAGRPAAQAIQNRPLPPGTDSINLPKLTTGTAMGVQTEAGTVTSQAIVTASVTAALQTMAGQIDVSQQLVDRSNPTVDSILFDDLTLAYDSKIDNAVLNSTVTNGKGLLQLTGINAVTYTDSSATVAELYPYLGSAEQAIATAIFMAPDLWIMHPRRWYWLATQVDTTGRPLVVPAGAPGFNAAALQDRVAAEAVVGMLAGLPVVIDSQIPTTGGVSTNQDQIIGLRSNLPILFEDSSPRLRAHEQVLDGTLQVRLQLYNYFALLPGRLPTAISAISGTGLTNPF